MYLRTLRNGRIVAILVMLALLGSWLPQAAAQSDVTGIDGNAYTSPTFAYSLAWDSQLWSVTDEFTSPTYDYLTLGSDGASFTVEGLYSYYGESSLCFQTERDSISESQGLSELVPLLDANGNSRESLGDGWVQGLYDVPASADGGSLANTLFLECRTLVPGSVVMVIIAWLDPEAQVDLETATADLLASVQTSPAGVTPLDPAAFENSVWQLADDLDAFWSGVVSDLGYTYEPPVYQSVTFPIEFDCGDGTTVEIGEFYCPNYRTVFIDFANLATAELPAGLGSIEFTLGHEVGHHIQVLLGFLGCTELSCRGEGTIQAVELQATCLSGAWIQDAAARNYFDPRVLFRMEMGVRFRLGESQGDADHGTGAEQLAAFMSGYESGIAACGVE